MPARRLIGVDVGGTGIKLGAVEVDGAPRLCARDVIENHAGRDPAEVVHEIVSRIRFVTDAAGWDRAEGVGVGCAGLVRTGPGTIAFSPNLPAWEGYALADALAPRLDLPVRVDNDANAFSLAEWMWGAGERSRDVLFLTLGTGIGGGIVSGGRLLRGAQGFAGEPGHMTLVLDGLPCACGNRGCAERYVGNREIVRATREHPGFAGDPYLADAEDLTPRHVSEAAEKGSVVAREVLVRVGTALGGLLVSLVNLFNPERVVIGGGVAQAGPLILEPAREHLERHSHVARHAPPRILAAGLGTSAGILGAAALLLEETIPAGS